MTSHSSDPRPADHERLYSQQEILRALGETMQQHPAFAYYPDATRAAMLAAIAANIDEHAPARIQPAEYLRHLRGELRRLQDPASLGRQAALSAVRLGGRALLNRALFDRVLVDRARQQALRVVQDAGTESTGVAQVLYTHSALEAGLRTTLRLHPQFGHYPEATRQELLGTLLESLDRASPRRLTYGAFLQGMLEKAGLQNASEPLGLIGSAARGAGKNLLGTLKRRVHEYTASSQASGSPPATVGSPTTGRPEPGELPPSESPGPDEAPKVLPPAAREPDRE